MDVLGPLAYTTTHAPRSGSELDYKCLEKVP